jgi:hypothetical protein
MPFKKKIISSIDINLQKLHIPTRVFYLNKDCFILLLGRIVTGTPQNNGNSLTVLLFKQFATFIF